MSQPTNSNAKVQEQTIQFTQRLRDEAHHEPFKLKDRDQPSGLF
jgi:hypothetical protein